MIPEYPYSKNDLLENPQTYQKSPFLGIDFLKAYKKSRRDVIALCDLKNFSLSASINNLKIIKKSDYSNFELEGYFSFLLSCTQSDLCSIRDHVNLFLKKFEIKKRLFTEYNQNFKEMSCDFNNLTNYILLSLLCIILYEKYSSLKYLNVVLKLNDVLCSNLNRISLKNKPFFCYIIKKEIEHVEKLCNEKGITI